MSVGALNRAWGNAIVETLRASGAGIIVVCPGARSSPLVAGLEGCAGVVTHFDERGAAFFALGHTRATGEPSVVITTSGSAVANLHPAAVEAAYAELPVIFLTADRPPELLGTGANQTIDQRGIFGPTVKAWEALPCPDDGVPWDRARALLERAWLAANSHPRGPVQINCPFREPLLDAAGPLISEFPPLSRPFAENLVPQEPPWDDDWKDGIVSVGQLAHAEQDRGLDILEFASALGWPVLADPLSGLPSRPPVIAHAELAIAAGLLPTPAAQLHLGGSMVSKRVARFLAGIGEERYVHISSSPKALRADGRDPRKVTCDPCAFCAAHTPPAPRAGSWLGKWTGVSERVGRAVDAWFARQSEITEPLIARMVGDLAPGHGNLFLGNSLPVREYGMFASRGSDTPKVYANRGASGIDGNIATAAGIAAATGRATLCVLGDLAALHDINSLALPAARRLPVTVLVINNGGGGIFRFLDLPSGGVEDLWETPHNFKIAPLAASMGIQSQVPQGIEQLRQAIRDGLSAGHPSLIEVRTDRRQNPKLHLEIKAEVARFTGP